MAYLSFQMQLGTSVYSRATLAYQADMNDVRSNVRRSPLLAPIALRWYLRCASRHDREATLQESRRQFVHVRPGGRCARPATGVCEASFFGCVLPQDKERSFRARALIVKRPTWREHGAIAQDAHIVFIRVSASMASLPTSPLQWCNRLSTAVARPALGSIWIA